MSENGSDSDCLTCWKITNCQKTSFCPAGQHPDIPCWEIASQLNDYRSRLNVCEDCLVYLAMQDNPVLLHDEIQEILKKRGTCTLETICALPLPKWASGG